VSGRLIVVTGTGTGIGKTHVSCALLQCAATRGSVLGYKPIESGVDGTTRTDAEQLAEAGSFHVKLSPSYRLRAPLSPHLAARLEHVTIAWEPIEQFVSEVRAKGVHVLLELPGGLFTPLTDTLRNVDVIGGLEPDVALLLAPDKLGVLHDVGATRAGAEQFGLRIDHVGLVAPSVQDTSFGTNAAELERFGAAVHGTWPRATLDELATHPATITVVDRWVG
jgi:dethiobiotin synthetase